jgi:uncharacterized protein (UPF0332 family)
MNERAYERAVKELTRAKKALLAAKTLLSSSCSKDTILEKDLFEDCVSRAYYAVLHAAKAALTLSEVEVDSHSGARSMFGFHLVKNGKIESMKLTEIATTLIGKLFFVI